MGKTIEITNNVFVVTERESQRDKFEYLILNDTKINDYMLALNIVNSLELFASNSFKEESITLDIYIISKRKEDGVYYLIIESPHSDFLPIYLRSYECYFISRNLNRLFATLHQIYSHENYR